MSLRCGCRCILDDMIEAKLTAFWCGASRSVLDNDKETKHNSLKTLMHKKEVLGCALQIFSIFNWLSPHPDESLEVVKTSCKIASQLEILKYGIDLSIAYSEYTRWKLE